MDLFEIVRERPSFEQADARPTCPFIGCRYPFGADLKDTSKILETSHQGHHKTQLCLCGCCGRRFSRHSVTIHGISNVWYTASRYDVWIFGGKHNAKPESHVAVMYGMPSCYESYVYHCAKCDGPVSRQYHQLDKDEPFPEPKPDENGIVIGVIISTIARDGTVTRRYRTKYACEECGHGGYTDRDYWFPKGKR